MQRTRFLISHSIKTKDAPSCSPCLQCPQQKGTHPGDTGYPDFIPETRLKFQATAGHQIRGCEHMCFWWWCWYLFHVYVHSNRLQKEKSKPSPACSYFLRLCTEKKASSYLPSHLTSYPNNFTHLESEGVDICRDRSATFPKSYLPTRTIDLSERYLLGFYRWIKYCTLKTPVMLEKTG